MTISIPNFNYRPPAKSEIDYDPNMLAASELNDTISHQPIYGGGPKSVVTDDIKADQNMAFSGAAAQSSFIEEESKNDGDVKEMKSIIEDEAEQTVVDDVTEYH